MTSIDHIQNQACIFFCFSEITKETISFQRLFISSKYHAFVLTEHFLTENSRTSPLFKQSSTLRFQDKICLENILFAGLDKLQCAYRTS